MHLTDALEKIKNRMRKFMVRSQIYGTNGKAQGSLYAAL